MKNKLNWPVKSIVGMTGAPSITSNVSVQFCGGTEAAKHWRKPEQSGPRIRNGNNVKFQQRATFQLRA